MWSSNILQPNNKGEFVNIAIEHVYNDGGRAEAGFKGKTGDCVVRSIAIASGISYKEVYDALAIGNEQQRPGKSKRKSIGKRTASQGIFTSRKWFKDYMKAIGFEWVPTMRIGQGCTVHLAASELPMGKLVVFVSKHATAVIDRICHDVYDPSRGGTRCVYGYWKFTKGE